MQAPRFVKKKFTIRRNGRVRPEDVCQGGNVGTFGVTSLHRLLKLLRVTEQNDAFRRLRRGHHVGE
jgi:hypothetical protein